MRTVAALAFSLFLAAPLAAQQATPPQPQPGEEVVDRVVAVVGDTVLLLSDVRTEMQRMQAQGQTIPTDPAGQEALFRQVVESRVNDLLLVEGARAAGITVTDAEVQDMVDRQVEQVRSSFPDTAAFTAALRQSNTTLAQYREQLTRQYSEQSMVQRFVGQRTAKMPRPPVSDAEARAYFDAGKESLGTRPANLSFQQVVIMPTASDSAKARARRTAEDVLAQLRAGGDFAQLARRFSGDPGSKERGGDLGWFRQGMMVRPFEDAAYSLRPGELSGVVETDFGFHVIRLEKVRGPERQARHILIVPEVGPADVALARTRADSVAAAARAGASVTELAAKYKTPVEQTTTRHLALDKLPPAYTLAFQSAAAGAVVGPFEVDANGKPTFVVAKLTERQESGPYDFADVAEQARDRVVEQKQMAQLVADLRRDTHVAVQL
ncbi:MAG TPA: peptidylprolyl isomerase [Longimicrobiaceae bacterium]|jgi:peptidyl-prolyl cis-trans isomerase SurA|nr:peptidylprolyl isomerase [Longimicrobiaceae bacterium]